MEKKFKQGKIMSFLRRNVYYVIMVMCIVAIGTMILVASLNKDSVEPTTDPIVDVSGDDPVDTTPSDDNPAPVDPPVDDTPAPYVMVFQMPVADYTEGTPYADSELVFNATLNCWKTHKGCDFVVATGTEVKSIEKGTVLSVTTDVLNGTVITIKHDEQYVSIYKSLAEDVAVEVGDLVSKGQVIGTASDTAWNESALGTHLHLEILKDGVNVNPMTVLPEVLK